MLFPWKTFFKYEGNIKIFEDDNKKQLSLLFLFYFVLPEEFH